MSEPTFYRATLTIQSFGTSADELRDRVRRTVETHPTLGFRLQDVTVEPWAAPSAELAHLSDGEFYREFNRRQLRQGHPAPSDLRPIAEPPPNNVQVVLWLSDRSVAIEFYPVVAYNYPEFGKPMWWSGIPGKYVRMGPLDGSNGWTIEGWTPLPSTLPKPTADVVEAVWRAVDACFDREVEAGPAEDDGYEAVRDAVTDLGRAPRTDDEINDILTAAYGAPLGGGQDEYERRRAAYRAAFGPVSS